MKNNSIRVKFIAFCEIYLILQFFILFVLGQVMGLMFGFVGEIFERVGEETFIMYLLFLIVGVVLLTILLTYALVRNYVIGVDYYFESDRLVVTHFGRRYKEYLFYDINSVGVSFGWKLGLFRGLLGVATITLYLKEKPWFLFRGRYPFYFIDKEEALKLQDEFTKRLNEFNQKI